MKNPLDKFIVDYISPSDMNKHLRKILRKLTKEKNLTLIYRMGNTKKRRILDFFRIDYLDKGIWGRGFVDGLSHAKLFYERKK